MGIYCFLPYKSKGHSIQEHDPNLLNNSRLKVPNSGNQSWLRFPQRANTNACRTRAPCLCSQRLPTVIERRLNLLQLESHATVIRDAAKREHAICRSSCQQSRANPKSFPKQPVVCQQSTKSTKHAVVKYLQNKAKTKDTDVSTFWLSASEVQTREILKEPAASHKLAKTLLRAGVVHQAKRPKNPRTNPFSLVLAPPPEFQILKSAPKTTDAKGPRVKLIMAWIL